MPDDMEINNLPNSTLFWILAMINKDEEEEAKRQTDLVEYLASYINPENVRRVKELQENTVKVSDDILTDTLNQIAKNKF